MEVDGWFENFNTFMLFCLLFIVNNVARIMEALVKVLVFPSARASPGFLYLSRAHGTVSGRNGPFSDLTSGGRILNFTGMP